MVHLKETHKKEMFTNYDVMMRRETIFFFCVKNSHSVFLAIVNWILGRRICAHHIQFSTFCCSVVHVVLVLWVYAWVYRMPHVCMHIYKLFQKYICVSGRMCTECAATHYYSDKIVEIVLFLKMLSLREFLFDNAC